MLQQRISNRYLRALDLNTGFFVSFGRAHLALGPFLVQVLVHTMQAIVGRLRVIAGTGVTWFLLFVEGECTL